MNSGSIILVKLKMKSSENFTPSSIPQSTILASKLLCVNPQTLAYYLDLLVSTEEEEECRIKFKSDPNFINELDRLERLVSLYNNKKLDGPELLAFEAAIQTDPKLREFVHSNLVEDYIQGKLDEQGRLALEERIKKDEELRNEIIELQIFEENLKRMTEPNRCLFRVLFNPN